MSSATFENSLRALRRTERRRVAVRGENDEMVFAALSKADRPLTAYELLGRLRTKGITAPPTVYRSLDRLIKDGLAHRLETLNAFVACANPHHRTSAIFAICRTCGTTAELSDAETGAADFRLGQAPALSRRRIDPRNPRRVRELPGAELTTSPSALKLACLPRADHQMIVHFDLRAPSPRPTISRVIGDVAARGRRIAARMVVHQDERARAELERALDHFARIDRRVVDGALLLHLLLDQHVLAVEKQHAEFLGLARAPSRRRSSRAAPPRMRARAVPMTCGLGEPAAPRPRPTFSAAIASSLSPFACSRSTGAAIDVAEAVRSGRISALASGLTSTRGIAEQQQLEHLVIRQGVAPAVRGSVRAASRDGQDSAGRSVAARFGQLRRRAARAALSARG